MVFDETNGGGVVGVTTRVQSRSVTFWGPTSRELTARIVRRAIISAYADLSDQLVDALAERALLPNALDDFCWQQLQDELDMVERARQAYLEGNYLLAMGELPAR